MAKRFWSFHHGQQNAQTLLREGRLRARNEQNTALRRRTDRDDQCRNQRTPEKAIVIPY
jgi:hypothetical protein